MGKFLLIGFLILSVYIVLGMAVYILYSLITDKMKDYCYMNDDEKRIVYTIVIFYPICIVYWFFRELVKTVFWWVKKLKKK
jgi:hypothetical protein